MKFYILVATALLIISCETKNNVEREIEAIPMDVDIVRFDQEFAKTTPQNLTSLKNKYGIFFPEEINDSIWLEKMQDSLQKQLETEVNTIFPNNDKLEDILVPLFQHIKYYFPNFKTPKVYTATTDVDYKNKVILVDSILVISLDTYLGSKHPFYEGIQKYIAENLKEEQLAPDVAAQYARKYISIPRERSFLSQMIYFGKELYLKDIWLPETTDANKIGYSEVQMTWAKENETEVWRYFVENELLYSTDPKIPGRFVMPAPFSKFYLEIDNESPGMIGRYIGWQIVRAYMKNNDITVAALMAIPADEIFKLSKYKPQK